MLFTVQANQSYHQEVARAGSDSGGADRANGKLSKARGAMEAADIAYRASVVQVEEARMAWQTQTETCADTFQVS